ncbi:hypothetical protein OnM2_050006 [Erysiphe neolycopersici]|uniref:Uncharacterized protein n=1 Tax=Erysiphe neolycopersici TaxID=212602 RepID=A0A420HT06_9PEZI|nr:hypothetical protein OnM2_050006 [Erysiphe neolycopersici]
MARIHGRFSSPDPLNDDSYLSLAKPQSQSRLRSKEITSSKRKNNKRKTFELDVGNDISPQKIRVTVEAGDDEFHDVINLQSRPISWPKKKIKACTQPLNNDSNQNSRNKLVATPKQTRERSIKPTGAASNKRSVTKGKKSPSTKAIREQNEVKNSMHDGEELDSDVREPPSRRKGGSLPRSRKSKATARFRSPTRSPKKKTSNDNVITSSINGDILEQERHISSIYDTPKYTELSHNVSVCDDSDQEVVGLQLKPLNEASGMERSGNHIETNPKLRLLANKNTNSQVTKNSNLYQGDNYGARSKSDPTYYPSPDSPEKFLDRNYQENSMDSSKFQSNQYSELHDLEDDQELNESTHCSEYRESDTILESEEFSMISVDSVPSLKEHFKTSGRNCTSPRRNSNLVTQNDYQRSFIAIHRDKIIDQEFHRPPNSSPKNISDLYQNSTQKSSNRSNDEIPLKRGSFSSDINQNSHQKDNSDQRLELKTLISGSLPNEQHKEYLSDIPTSDFKSAPSKILSLNDSSKVLQTVPKTNSPSQLSENIYPSMCRLPTPKITSPLADDLAQDLENLVPSNRIPMQKTPRGQLDLCLTNPQLCSSPLVLKHLHHSGTSHQEDNQYTNKDNPNHKSTLSSSPFLTSQFSKRCQSSHDQKPRGLKENVITASLHSAREISSSSRSTHLDSNSLLSPFLSPSTNGESVLSRAVEKVPLPHQNEQEILSGNFNQGCKNTRSSEVSELLEKSTLIDDNSRFISEAHQGQMNSIEICQEFAPKGIGRQNDPQNNEASSQKPREFSFTPVASQVSHLNNLTSSLDSDEEEDFDLLLETINSATPLASRQNSQIREPYQLPSTPQFQNSRWSNSKITASNDKFSGSRISDKKKRNQLTKIHRNNTTQEISSASKQSGNNFVERVNIFQYQIPQKSNFRPTVRKTGDTTHSSCLNVSPSRPLPTMESNSIKSLQPRNSKTDSYDTQIFSNDHYLFSPSRQGSGSRSQSKANSFSTEVFRDVFSPKHRASSPVSSNITNKSFDISSKPNNYILSSKFRDVDPSSSSNQVIGSEKQNRISSVQFSTSKKNPDRNLNSTPQKQKLPTTPTSSPTKSCLRSPLKSQMERLDFPRSPSKVVTFVSSSPTASSPIFNLSSASTWTRNHWLILDEIVQRWKSENDRESSPASETYSMQNHRQKPRRNSTRVISRLLGKYVHSAEGERMKLEQWHLEVVDEFRGMVPGWDEKVIAMRLFALLVGERVRAERVI